MSTRLKCKAQRADGQPCGSWAVGDNGYCLSHDPLRAAAMVDARRKGGIARHGRNVGATGNNEPVKLATLADVLALLERTANDLLAMENSVARGRALVSLAQAWAGCWETSELERRLSALEGLHHDHGA